MVQAGLPLPFLIRVEPKLLEGLKMTKQGLKLRLEPEWHTAILTIAFIFLEVKIQMLKQSMIFGAIP
jgi:hypothetical protein